jgi:hypothetical protein
MQWKKQKKQYKHTHAYTITEKLRERIKWERASISVSNIVNT